ncbi:uncharacterized protein KRP23_10736 [Phytophthora ramorum]|uniref:uncharacterized protein n=1 Tax=Phytophthora ramorum TaxID=164328 RepID=UPI0030A6CF6D|nr:hypothetical protein KRP23_10736 [Phytophthora ramorum]
MTPEVDAVETEVFGVHLTTAKAMRVAYQVDVSKSDKDNIVLIMDFAQNLTLPHVPDVPSSCYNHFMYTERKGGKGANEVTSMLHHSLDLYSVFDAATKYPVDKDAMDTSVTVWADNCGGQNKNAQVVWYLLFLVEYRVLNEAHLKFFTKGHTKNACDRGFGIIKRHMRRESCWTMDTLVEAVERATENVSVVNLEEEEKPFWASKSFFAARYRKVAGIQKYHIFRITREKSGFVECKETPASKGVWIRLHKDKEPKTQSLADFLSAWSVVPKANDKPLNPEKLSGIYSKVLPFVPSQFTDDPIYMKPSARMIETAQEIKRSRRSKADKKRKEREEVGVSVDDDEVKEAVV